MSKGRLSKSSKEHMNLVAYWKNGHIYTKEAKPLSYEFWDFSQAWEGVRCFVQHDLSVKPFRLDEHLNRLQESADFLNLYESSKQDFLNGFNLVVESNPKEDYYVLINTSKSETSIVPFFEHHKIKDLDIQDFIVSPGYPFHKFQIKSYKGYNPFLSDRLILDRNEYVLSGLNSNVFVVKNDIIMTPPNDGNILQGITRGVVAGILKSPKFFSKYHKYPILIEKKITIPDILLCDCAFLAGTYLGICKINSIKEKTLGKNGSDFYFKAVEAEYTDLVRGRSSI